ncbi:MAG: hypothetical protein ACLQJR_09660 [Stellaceae bacterium]
MSQLIIRQSPLLRDNDAYLLHHPVLDAFKALPPAQGQFLSSPAEDRESSQ